MLRGGSWINNGRNVRSANRNRNEPGNRNDNTGFRLARAQMGLDGLFSDQTVILTAQPVLVLRQKGIGLRYVSRGSGKNPERLPDDLLCNLKVTGAYNLLEQDIQLHSREPEVFPLEWASDWGHDQYGYWMAFTVYGVRQCLRWIEPGTFMMGSPENEPERFDDEHQHPVTLTKGFWLAETSCSQGLWEAVMGDNPSGFKGKYRPMENVSWDDCMGFITTLNDLKPGLDLRLPTEAEWEYACRAGTETPFSFGDNLTPEQVNYNGEHPYAGGEKGKNREETVDVKSFPANPWGLYEMHGNVWEWCSDWYGDYPEDAVVDPGGPEMVVSRVLRGGSWFSIGRNVRSAAVSGTCPASASTSPVFVLPEVRRPAEPDRGRRRGRQTERSGVGQPRRAPCGMCRGDKIDAFGVIYTIWLCRKMKNLGWF